MGVGFYGPSDLGGGFSEPPGPHLRFVGVLKYHLFSDIWAIFDSVIFGVFPVEIQP